VFLHCSHIHHYHHHALSDELQGAVDAIVAVPVPVPVPAEIDLVVSSSWQIFRLHRTPPWHCEDRAQVSGVGIETEGMPVSMQRGPH
jgi:hypothetical protein